MTDVPTDAPQAVQDGLIDRLRKRGNELAQGRRLTLPLPGWDDLGDGRGLWARFTPLSRRQQTDFTFAPLTGEIDMLAPMLADVCEEVLIGTLADAQARQLTALADEPDVRAMRGDDADLPLRFDADLGKLTGVGGTEPASVVKRMLVRGADDLPFFGVAGELLRWSGEVGVQGVEGAAGE